MSTPRKERYFFITDKNNKFISIKPTGEVVTNSKPIPLDESPEGWDNIELAFGTNNEYFSLNRSFTIPLKFVNDGADILRYFYYNGKGYEEELYIIIVRFNSLINDPSAGIYELEYKGRIDLTKVKDDPETGFTVNSIEGGLISFFNANKEVNYEIPCNPTNKDAIKVVFDGVDLYDKLNYEYIPIKLGYRASFMPNVYINNEGDSVGIVHGDTTLQDLSHQNTDPNFLKDNGNYIFYSAEPIKNVVFEGYVKFSFDPLVDPGFYSQNIVVLLQTSLGQVVPIIPFNTIITPTRNIIPFKASIDLAPEEKVFMIYGVKDLVSILYLEKSSFSVSYKSINNPSLAYALRPLNLFKALVNKMSYGRYTADSKFLSITNNVVVTSGEALRELKDALNNLNGVIKTNFKDAYKSYNTKYNLGIKIVNNVLWIEPKGDIYNDSTQIFDLGEVANLSINDASEYYVGSVKIGSPKQDYNERNGRYEFNDTTEWKLPVNTSNKVLDLVSVYRMDCYGIEFIRGRLNNKDTTDNKGDNEVFLVDISDEKQTISTPVHTFIIVEINTTPTLPTIAIPFDSDIIASPNPTVRGFAEANKNIGILVDGVQDGFTTTDSKGAYTYNVKTGLSSYSQDAGTGAVITTGIHTISAAYADRSGVVAIGTQSVNVSVTIDTRVPAPMLITYPQEGDYLYNNLPLIKGIAPHGTSVNISYFGLQIGTVIADGSDMWEFQLAGSLPDGLATIHANSATVDFTVISSTVDFPLITSIVSGTTLYYNTPLIRGVSKPNATFFLSFDYSPTGPVYDNFGNLVSYNIAPVSITSDALGNWQYQMPAYLTDGQHVLSTTETDQEIFLKIDGYKLYREQYQQISGVPVPIVNGVKRSDVTGAVFNVRLSPKRDLMAHENYLNGLLNLLPSEKVTFLTADKNKNLSTTLNGVTIQENKEIIVKTFPNPLFFPYEAAFTTKVPFTFSAIMSKLNAGNIKITHKGYPIYLLPIGEMKCKPASNEAQEWKLLLSPLNSLNVLNKLSLGTFLIDDNMQNQLSISDYSPVHFVKYDYQKPAKYHSKTIYEDRFNARTNRFERNGNYSQKWESGDTINLQLISYGYGQVDLLVYNCEGVEVDILPFNIVADNAVKLPAVKQEISIDCSNYQPGGYQFVLSITGIKIGISEKQLIAPSWPETGLIEYYNTKNKPQAYFADWRPAIRVEMFEDIPTPDGVFVEYNDEPQDAKILSGTPFVRHKFYFGDAYGIPDYLAKKINAVTLLNNVRIDGTEYTRVSDFRFENVTLTEGYPMNYYSLEMREAKNSLGLTISDVDINNEILSTIQVDLGAFGAGTGVIDVDTNG